ncbi:MAG: serine hydrolase domain-containing protein [Flavobacteriaceae bacterium]
MKKSFVLLGLLTTAFSFAQLAQVDPQQEGVSAERLERISEVSKSYLEDEKVAGIATMVSRNGKIIYAKAFGERGVDDSKTLKIDDLFRIYSMTKPIVAVAAMQLYEKGMFHLNDPISKFLPELAELSVMDEEGNLTPNQEPISMQQLLTHTAGFSYGFSNSKVDQAYNKAELWKSKDSDDFIKRVAALPLHYKPGERWHYSIAVDLTGVIVERLSGMGLDEYLQTYIFEPLGMVDTFFEVPKKKMKRFLPNHYYDYGEKSLKTVQETKEKYNAMSNYEDVSMFSGGGGLVSTAMDYMLFMEALQNGGSLNGNRILGPKTLQYMIRNHLSGSIEQKGGAGENPLDEASNNGFGFGLGFGLVTNSVNNSIIGSEGEYNWGGAAGTVFWIDPVENVSVVSMIQLMSSPWKLREDLKVAVYQALDQINE